jgi:hypothetical protein
MQTTATENGVSNIREQDPLPPESDPEICKNKWIDAFMPLVALYCCALVAGICCFVKLNHVSMDIIYPRYSKDRPNYLYYNFSSGTMIEELDKRSVIMESQGQFTNAYEILAILIPVLFLIWHCWNFPGEQ